MSNLRGGVLFSDLNDMSGGSDEQEDPGADDRLVACVPLR